MVEEGDEGDSFKVGEGLESSARAWKGCSNRVKSWEGEPCSIVNYDN